MINVDKIFALGDLRRKLVAQQHEEERRIHAHMSEFDVHADSKDNKIWAVKDARLCERKARTMEIINLIDQEIHRYE